MAVAAPLVRSALLAGGLEGLRHLRLRGALKLELGDPRQQRRGDVGRGTWDVEAEAEV